VPKVVSREVAGGDDPLDRAAARRLSEAGGLTQFGAVEETFWPGGRSSRLHWHLNEGEMVDILDGTGVLIEGTAEEVLGPGDAACFKAGVPVDQCQENRGTSPVRHLVIGTRSSDDVVRHTEDGGGETVKHGA
jgi:uncharacterized cupin superfamily protein